MSEDSDQFIETISEIEEIFKILDFKLERRGATPKNVMKDIHYYRVSFLNTMKLLEETETEIKVVAERSLVNLLNNIWWAINELSGIILHKEPHNLYYCQPHVAVPEEDMGKILSILHMNIFILQKHFQDLSEAIKNHHSTKSWAHKLAGFLLNFIPSFKLQTRYKETHFPFFSKSIIEKYFVMNSHLLDTFGTHLQSIYEKVNQAVKDNEEMCLD